ncbi:MAG: VOC family protein [Alphaproteobacteria bacterium]|nr:VOC family protein [Alphaproteobacteria bacterium]
MQAGFARLTHVALHVRDVAASAAFYQSYCGLVPTHARDQDKVQPVIWLSEPGKEEDFAIVLIGGGTRPAQGDGDFSHLGFACDSRAEVDRVAARAADEDRLVWPARQEPPPVGYYCGIADPDGNLVEFSFGQPLGERR